MLFPKVWPERWVEELRALEAREMHRQGRLLRRYQYFPGAAQLLHEGGGTITDRWQDFLTTPFVEGATRLAAQMEQRFHDGYASAWFSQHVVASYLVARWHYHGYRYYAVDDATAMALMDTDFADFPIADFRLPMPTFWVTLPPSIQWTIRSDSVDSPNATQEPTQRVEGVLVGGMEHDANGAPGHLRLIAAGHSRFPGEDALLWYTTGFGDGPTMAAVSDMTLRRTLDPTNFQMYGAVDFIPDSDMLVRVVKFVVGLCLYLNCVHPQLVVHEPPPMPTTRRKGRHKRDWKAYDAATKVRVTYVGGPDHGHRVAAAPTEPAGTRKPPTPHTRAGHIRRQWVGDAVHRRTEYRWIRPTRIGDWSRILVWEQQRQTIFKTRPAEKVVEQARDAEAV